MQRVSVKGQLRTRLGKGSARQIRREGHIPAVLYGGGKSTPLTLNPLDIIQILKSESGENALLNLKLKKDNGSEMTTTAILRDFQRDPVSGQFLHADLFEISMTEALRLRIPLLMVGSPSGVKEGGVLQHSLRELEIECLPAQIPDHIEVQIGDLGIGQSIHVRDLQLASGIKVFDDPDQSILSVAAPISDEQLEKILTGTPPAEGEVEAPEVAGKGKEKVGAEGSPAEGDTAQKSETGK